MKRVRTSRTSAEREVEKVLRRLRLRYKRNPKSLPGTPDFLIQDKKLAVFVDGCFWTVAHVAFLAPAEIGNGGKTR